MTEMKNVFRLNKLGKAFSISDNVHLIYVMEIQRYHMVKNKIDYELYSILQLV